MRTDRRASLSVAAVFLALIGAPGVIQAVAEIRRGERPRVLDVFYQPPTAGNLHAYERSLEEASPVIVPLRRWTQYLQWNLLADAGDRVVVGRAGWLFYGPSVRYVVERPTDVDDPLSAIRAFRDQLEARGIRLVVVPVPGKESVYPEMLADGAEAFVCEATRRLFERFRECNLEYVDLFDVFGRARRSESRSSPGRLYLSQDTHWSPEGARIAAAAVARRVRGGGVLHSTYSERPVTVRRRGDLVEMLRVPSIEDSVEPETVDCRQVVRSDDGTPYRDADASDVLVLGDSFLRIFERDEPGSAGFLAHLAREIGRPLAAIVSDGGASTVVRQELARRPMLLENKTLVIWEFAEREIRFAADGWRVVPLGRPRARRGDRRGP